MPVRGREVSKLSAVVFAGLWSLIVQTAVAQGKQSASQSQSAPIQQPASATPAHATTRTKLFGMVRSVDPANRKIVVRTETGKTRTIALSAGTYLDKGSNHKEIDLADLRSGDPVDIIMERKAVRAIHVFLVPK